MTTGLRQPTSSTCTTKLLDVVYPIRRGDNNPELRWSLRCLEANYPHAQVWIVGHKPAWLTGINHIRGGNKQPSSAANVYHNILIACTHPDTPDQLVVMNDDFFITQPLTDIPITYRGPLKEHLQLPRVTQAPNSWWSKSLRTTLIVLQALGHRDPLSYELHNPLPVDKAAMAETLQWAVRQDITPDNPPQWRTLYGVLNNIGGRQSKDCKAIRGTGVGKPFHSTDDKGWTRFHSYFGHTYPTPCKYEQQR